MQKSKTNIFVGVSVTVFFGLSLYWVESRSYQKGFYAGLLNHQKAEKLMAELSSCESKSSDALTRLQQAQGDLARSAPIVGFLQNNIAEQDKEIAALKERMSFYESVYGAKTSAVVLREFRIKPQKEGEYVLHGIVSKNDDKPFTGKLVITLKGPDDQLLKLPVVDLKFKHFQEIQKNVSFPADFIPEILALDVYSMKDEPLAQQNIQLSIKLAQAMAKLA